ncbi:MAG: glycosyltransferase [Candidatus Buchananbacteria bacterium]|jgi:glycosyltransferase involved in cell wall biosynthesis
MRIGIDCRTISDPAGVGTYTRELVRHLLEIDGHNHYVLFFDNAFSGIREYEKNNVTIKFLPSRKLKRYLPIIYSHFIIAHAMNQERLDVCLFPANAIPLGYKGRTMLTIHDLAVYKMPELFPNKLINFDRKIVVPTSISRADKIIAVSQSTKKDAMELFKASAEKIEVVYEGI